MRAEIKSSRMRGRDREEEREDGRGKEEKERRQGRYPADEPAMKPRRTRCLFLQSMEGYIRGLMALYHATLLRSLSCVLGVHTREREQYESVIARARKSERENLMNKARNKGWKGCRERCTCAYISTRTISTRISLES